MLPSKDEWQQALRQRHGAALQERLAAAKVAVCGLAPTLPSAWPEPGPESVYFRPGPGAHPGRIGLRPAHRLPAGLREALYGEPVFCRFRRPFPKGARA